MLYPWQHDALTTLLAYKTYYHDIPQTLLIHAVPGWGLTEFADYIAAMVYCALPHAPCTQCQDCFLVKQHKHPDVKALSANVYTIEACRELIAWCQRTAHRATKKIIIIEHAEQLSIKVANALLKTIEEPSMSTYFILLSPTPGNILSTLRSRCQIIQGKATFSLPSIQWVKANLDLQTEQKAEYLLKLAKGGPLLTATLQTAYQDQQAFLEDFFQLFTHHTSPLALAQAWHTHAIEKVLNYCYYGIFYLIRCKMTHTVESRFNTQTLVMWPLEHFFASLDRIHAIRTTTRVYPAMNKQLMIENILIFTSKRLAHTAC